MINIAICDDDTTILNLIENHIASSIFHNDIECFSFSSIERLKKYQNISNIYFDMYFLDIDFPGQSGFDLAKEIRENDRTSLIIFITNYTNLIFDSLQFMVFDFISKPIDFTHFNTILTRAIKILFDTKTNYICSINRNLYSIPLKDIYYIEKSLRKATLYTKTKKYTHYATTAEIWQKLNKTFFVSVYNSIIVNMLHIKTINSSSLILENSVTLPIGLKYHENVNKSYIQFISTLI